MLQEVCQNRAGLAHSVMTGYCPKPRVWLCKVLFIRLVRKIVKSDYLLCHVCPSVHMERLCSHTTDFHEIWHLSIFWKSVTKIQVWLKSDKNNGYLHEDACTFTTIYHWIILRLKKVSDKSCTENHNTYLMLNISPKICHLWDNVNTYSKAGRATGDSMVHGHCMLDN